LVAGKRELIIGDRQTGKTANFYRTPLQSKGTKVFCIYVAVGQKIPPSRKSWTGSVLRGAWNIDGCCASAAEQAPLQIHCALFRRHDGRVLQGFRKHALIIYDD